LTLAKCEIKHSNANDGTILWYFLFTSGYGNSLNRPKVSLVGATAGVI